MGPEEPLMVTQDPGLRRTDHTSSHLSPEILILQHRLQDRWLLKTYQIQFPGFSFQLIMSLPLGAGVSSKLAPASRAKSFCTMNDDPAYCGMMSVCPLLQTERQPCPPSVMTNKNTPCAPVLLVGWGWGAIC